MQRARTDQAKDERRQAFLAAALDEFFERGFAAARMDDIAKRAGLSKGAIYLYFDSKEALFTELIESIAVPNIERVITVVDTVPSATEALQGAMAIAPQIVRQTPLPRIAKILIADAGAFPDVVRGYRRNIVDRGLAAIAALLERGAAAGEFEVEDPQLTARLVVAPMIFSAIWTVVFEIDPEARLDVEALFKLHERMLLRALSAPGKGVSC